MARIADAGCGRRVEVELASLKLITERPCAARRRAASETAPVAEGRTAESREDKRYRQRMRTRCGDLFFRVVEPAISLGRLVGEHGSGWVCVFELGSLLHWDTGNTHAKNSFVETRNSWS